MELLSSHIFIPENGNWEAWTRWTGCSNPVNCVAFDRQRKKRTRICNNPCSGDTCSGASSQTLKCTPRCCEFLKFF